MTSWQEIDSAAPELARRVQACFDAGTNKTIATLRKDGAPRISATELTFANGEVSFGMMGGSRKLADVRRDPRVAIHAPTLEPPSNVAEWAGDAKLAGLAIPADPPAEGAQPGAGYFVLDVREVVLTYVGTPRDHLVIETWHAGRGSRQVKRY